MGRKAPKSRAAKRNVRTLVNALDDHEEEESISTMDNAKEAAVAAIVKPPPPSPLVKVKVKIPLEEFHHTRSSDPSVLEAPPTRMTLADQGLDNSFGHGLGLIYTS
jgi:hypothetical protein